MSEDQKNPLEMRRFERNDFDTPVIYSDEQIDRYHDAMMHNFSDQGLYFESDEPLRVGSKIFVKTINFCSVNKCEVRWCSKLDSDEKDMYGIGLECQL